MSKLDELQRLCDEATPGEWYWMHNGNALLSNSTTRRPVVLLASQDGCFKTRDKQGLLKSLDDDDADAKFIAAARTYMPLLIAVARAANDFLSNDGSKDWTLTTLRTALSSLEQAK